jgi:hypothetical protein
MLRLAAISALLAIAIAGCSSAPRLSPISIPTSEPVPWFGLGPTGCPTALLEGVLARNPDSVLGVAGTDGTADPVRWPNGWFVTDEGGLVLHDGGGQVVAREGEYISAGGGMDGADRFFIVCSEVGTVGKS